MSIPLNKLTSYVQQLRSFLPDATTFLTRRESKQDERMETTRHEECEDYVTALMDSALVTDWNKLSPEVIQSLDNV